MKQPLRHRHWISYGSLPLFVLLVAWTYPNSPSPLTPQTAPVFIDPTPGDLDLDCITDIPPAPDLRALNMNGDTLLVSATDSPDPNTIDPCTGGTVVRSWTATDTDSSTTTVMQTISVAPDTIPPSVPILDVRDTVSCEIAFGPTPNSLQYSTWLNSRELAVATNASDDCVGGLSISKVTDPGFNHPCGTALATFMVSDACGNTTEVEFSFTTYDTIAPILGNLPPMDTSVLCSNLPFDTTAVTVTDNCTAGIIPVFTETNNQITDGSCAEFEYTITRTWTATDSCGNSDSFTQTIEVIDNVPPTFDVPASTTISCTDDPSDLSLTGEVMNAMDNCSPTLDISFVDSLEMSSCPQNMNITRFWTVRDVCGNPATKVQFINIRDTAAPTFSVPADITVNCEEADELGVTGEPTDLIDNCDPAPMLSSSDLFIAGSCENSFTIVRTWMAEDACGNQLALDQTITVIDTVAPSFQNAPQNLTIDCVDGIDLTTAFNDWTTNLAQAMATDNCSTGPGEIKWILRNSGSADTVSLSGQDCSLGNGLILERAVDFIAEDECGNRDTMTATFSVTDNVPPTLNDCPNGLNFGTDPGQCTALIQMMPPRIEDACALDTLSLSASTNVNITSQAAPGMEGDTPVDPIDLELNLATPLPINATGSGTLSIQLSNADAEAAEEFFWVYGEDGTLLGQTALSAAQCANSDTTFTLSIAQINAWAADGRIDIRLEPNIVPNALGRTSVNDICVGGSTVTANVQFPSKNFTGIRFEYAVNGSSRVVVDPIAPFDILFEQGNHLVTYYATDCAGNVDSCAFGVMIEDREAPVLSCSANITASVAADSCTAVLSLPLPAGVSDNCAVFNENTTVLPADTSSALLQFDFDNNLNDFLPRPVTFSFTGVAANAYGDVQLQIDFRGDFSSNGAFAQILGDDGSLLASTNVGDADCSTPGQRLINIPAATFNLWAGDGTVDIQFVPNDINVPPGLPGDGINPCDPVMNNGDTDGSSYVFAQLAYASITPSYYTSGATEIGTTTFPAPIIRPELVFNQGVTDVFYLLSDLAGNADTCSFSVTVEDNTPPIALCQATTLFINPSGVQVEIVDAATVDAGSTDNCAIDSVWLSPNTFDCNDVGTNPTVTLSVRDNSGNISTCSTIVAIAPRGPEPTATSGLCGGDTLFLSANPPEATGGVVYTYRWFDPDNNLFSMQENPIIMGIDSDDEGPYRVEISGITGCVAEGVVVVSIEDLPLTPSLTSAASVCNIDDIVLSSPTFPPGNNVIFRWYRGFPPNGTLVGSTTTPQLVIPGPHPLGNLQYYVTVEANGCLSPPSQEITISSEFKPTAEVAFSDTLICSNAALTLGSVSNGTGLAYEWTGPNNFTSTQQFPVISPVTAADAGFYYLRTRRNGCFSEFDSTLVSVKPLPARPMITSNGPICVGANLILQTPATGASAYHWIGPDNAEYLTTVPTLVLNNAIAENAGNWRVYITRNGCDSEPSVALTVAVNPIPEAGAEAVPDPACVGNTVTLQAFSNLSGVSYNWTGPNFQASGPNPQLTNVNQEDVGTYRVVVSTTAACADTAEVNLEVFPSVVLNGISDNAPACLEGGEDIVLTATAGPNNPGTYIYEWTGPQSFSASGSNVIVTNVGPANSGNYSLIVRTPQGCALSPTTYTLDLNFAPPQPSPPTVISGSSAFCTGDDMELTTTNYSGNVLYMWTTPGRGTLTSSSNVLQINNLTAGDTGGYRVSVIRDGCASPESAARTITVNAVPSVNASSNSPICAGEMLQLEASNFPNASYSWGGPNAFNSGLPNPVRMNALTSYSGTYFVVPDVAGCYGDTVYLDVTVKARPAALVLVAAAPICVDDPQAVLNLTIDPTNDPPGTYYQWYVGDGNTPLGDTTSQAVFPIAGFNFFTGDGDYTFYASSTLDDCESDLSAPLTVRLNSIPINEAFAGIDTTACSGEFVLQAATPELGSGQWSFVGDPGNAVLVNPNQPNSMLAGLSLEDSLYTLRWTLSNGACTNYDFDDVNILVSAGEAADAGDDFRICPDEPLFLEAQAVAGNTSMGMWTQGGGQQTLGVTIEDPSDPFTEITMISPDNVYSFTWRVTSACGVQEDEVLVFVSDPNPDAGADFVACGEDASALLTAAEPLTGSSGMWSSPDAEVVFDEVNQATTEVSNLAEGPNILVWTIDEGICGEDSRDTIIVEYKTPADLVADAYTVSFGGSVDFQPLENDMVPAGSTVVFINGSAEGRIEELGDGQFRYTAPANFVGTEQVVYIVQSAGCDDVESTITFTIGAGAVCDPPNLFTPNGDGVNDAFVIPCLLDEAQFPRSQVVVFNNWGDEVFRSQIPYQNNWRGTYDGEPLPDNTYFYVIDLGDGSEPISGFIVIQR